MNMIRRALLAIAAACAALLFVGREAPAQTIVVASCAAAPAIWAAGQSGRPIIIDTTGTQCVSAAVSASITGFAPATTGTPISVTTGGVTGTLPAGSVVVASNVGTTNIAYCKLGASATTADQPISPNGGWFAFTVGASTQLTCITSTSTTTVNMVGGGGLPTGTGGGGGGSGGGGAITAASGSYASGAFSAGSMVDLLTMRGTKNAGTAAANAMLTGGVYNSTPLTLTDTQQASLQFDANGYLKVNTAAGAAAGGTSSNFGSGFPTPGTAVGFSDGTNMVAAKVGAIANVAAATNMINVIQGCQYNATPLTVTDTRYQSMQCDVNGFTKVTVTNATTAIANNADGVAASTGGNSPVVNYNYVWNGTTWDRQAGTTAGTKVTAASGALASGAVVDLTNMSAATAAAVPTKALYVGVNVGGNLTGMVGDPCQTVAKSYTPISMTSATTTRIIAPTTSKKTYLCSLVLYAGAADNVAVVEGTGGTCGTGTAGVIGGTTAANGVNIAANGGLTWGSGISAVAATAGTNVDTCLITSSSGPLAGHASWVQQ